MSTQRSDSQPSPPSSRETKTGRRASVLIIPCLRHQDADQSSNHSLIMHRFVGAEANHVVDDRGSLQSFLLLPKKPYHFSFQPGST